MVVLEGQKAADVKARMLESISKQHTLLIRLICKQIEGAADKGQASVIISLVIADKDDITLMEVTPLTVTKLCHYFSSQGYHIREQREKRIDSTVLNLHIDWSDADE